jgi:hypothetical protein
MEPTTVAELGLSDHQAQVLPVLSKNHGSINRRILERPFGENNVRGFKYLLIKKTWQELFTDTEVNAKFEDLINLVTFFCYSLPSIVQI